MILRFKSRLCRRKKMSDNRFLEVLARQMARKKQYFIFTRGEAVRVHAAKAYRASGCTHSHSCALVSRYSCQILSKIKTCLQISPKIKTCLQILSKIKTASTNFVQNQNRFYKSCPKSKCVYIFCPKSKHVYKFCPKSKRVNKFCPQSKRVYKFS